MLEPPGHGPRGGHAALVSPQPGRTYRVRTGLSIRHIRTSGLRRTPGAPGAAAPYTEGVTDAQVSRFVDRLIAGTVEPAEYGRLSPEDLRNINRCLKGRRQAQMQAYVNAVFSFRLQLGAEQATPKRSYSEAEILAELELG